MWIGRDYHNPTISSLENVPEWDKSAFNKNKNPRMPWRDVQVMVRGKVVEDLC